MIEKIFLQICKDDKIGFESVTNIRPKMEGISYQRIMGRNTNFKEI